MHLAVVGGGVYGLACADAALLLGHQVTLFEPAAVLGEQSSSRGKLRIYRTAAFEGEPLARLMTEALVLWRGLGPDIVHQVGGLYIGSPESALITGSERVASSNAVGLETGVGDQPGFRVPSGHRWAFEKTAGSLASDVAVFALRERAVANGLQVEVASASGVLTGFDRVIYAAGPAMATMFPFLPLTVSYQLVRWYEASSEHDAMPIFAQDAGEIFIYGFPRTPFEDGVKVGSHFAGPGTREEALLLAPKLDAAADALLPGLGTAYRSEVCRYTNTPDGQFWIDWHPEDKNVVLISACSGHGFKYAIRLAELAVEMAVSGERPAQLEPFSSRKLS
jgi:sarcosine oxidase